MQLFYERVSFLEGEICTFTICNKVGVELRKRITPALSTSVYGIG